MPTYQERADHLAACLSAVGLTPHVTEDHEGTYIEAELPHSVSTETWREVLAVLETGDRFGLALTSAGGRTLWAAVARD